jgi:hypothetical protein
MGAAIPAATGAAGGGGAQWLLPLIMGSMGAASGVGQAMQGDPSQFEPYGGDPGDLLDPRRMLTQNVRDVGHLGSVLAERAAMPVTLPGAFTQPTPWYAGGGVPFPIGVTGMDPALFNPATHQQRAGTQFAEPMEWRQDGPPSDAYRWMFGLDEGTYGDEGEPVGTGYGPRRGGPDARTSGPWANYWRPEDFEGVRQTSTSPDLQVGGGIPQLMANFELLGVVADPTSGDLTVDPEVMAGRREDVRRASTNEAMFMGDTNMRRQTPAGPEPGTGLVQPQFGTGPGRPDPGRFQNPYTSQYEGRPGYDYEALPQHGGGLWEGLPGDKAPAVTRRKPGDPPLNT